MNQADVVVVGGGHNGLVAAVLAAQSGLRVTVLERADHLGGATVGEVLFPRTLPAQPLLLPDRADARRAHPRLRIEVTLASRGCPPTPRSTATDGHGPAGGGPARRRDRGVVC